MTRRCRKPIVFAWQQPSVGGTERWRACGTRRGGSASNLRCRRIRAITGRLVGSTPSGVSARHSEGKWHVNPRGLAIKRYRTLAARRAEPPTRPLQIS